MTGALPPHTLRIPGQATCKYCATVLTHHQVAKGGICDMPKCQMRQVQDASRAVFQRDWDNYVGRQRRAIEASGSNIAAATKLLDAEIEEIAVGVVPHLDRATTVLPQERRAEFAAHLDEIIAKAWEEGEPEIDLSPREREEADEEPIIDATCATCRGKCCVLGGPAHGFLTYQNIQMYRQRKPGASAAEIRQHYLDRLPDTSVEHSCVYHGPMGCVLPRTERGDVCNKYHCNPQTQLLLKMRQMKTDHAIIVANEDDAGPNVAVFDTTNGWTPVTGNAELDGFRAEQSDEAIIVSRAVDAALSQLPPNLPASGSSIPPEETVCEWCKQPIDQHKAVTTKSCGQPDCEKQRIERASRETARLKHERYVAKRERVLDAYAAELDEAASTLGLARSDLLVGIVPHQNSPIETLPPERRAAFEAHLDTITASGFAVADPNDYHNSESRQIGDAPETTIADACCATCQGSCCTLGGETMAFLGIRDVCRFRLEKPEATPADFKAHYLAYLPEGSVAGSCVYHTLDGCVVPREERADICNTFHCKGISMLGEEWKLGDQEQAVIVAHKDTVPKALAHFDKTRGWQPVITDKD